MMTMSCIKQQMCFLTTDQHKNENYITLSLEDIDKSTSAFANSSRDDKELCGSFFASAFLPVKDYFLLWGGNWNLN